MWECDDQRLFHDIKRLCYRQGLVRIVRGYDPLLTGEDIDQIIWLSIQEAKRNYSEFKSIRNHTNRHKIKRKPADLKSVVYIYVKKNLFEAVNAQKNEIERYIVSGDLCIKLGEKEYLAKKRKYNGNGYKISSTRIVKYMEDLKDEHDKRSSEEMIVPDETFSQSLFCDVEANDPENLLIKKEEKNGTFDLFGSWF